MYSLHVCACVCVCEREREFLMGISHDGCLSCASCDRTVVLVFSPSPHAVKASSTTPPLALVCAYLCLCLHLAVSSLSVDSLAPLYLSLSLTRRCGEASSATTTTTTGCGARSTSLWVHRKLFWQLSRDGNLHGSGMSHAMTASPKSSFTAPWRMGDVVVRRENAGWTTAKSGHPSSCARTDHDGLPQKRLEESFGSIIPHVPRATRSVEGLD